MTITAEKTLFDLPKAKPTCKHYEFSEAGFVEFDKDHPDIWKEFERLANILIIDRQAKHGSADAILHHIRFDTELRSGEKFKINNNWSAFYSRKFTTQNPQYKYFFTQKERKNG